MKTINTLAALLSPALLTLLAGAAGTQGYYRQPTLRGDTIIFVSEGDLWKTSLKGASSDAGAVATRLTSHPGDEGNPKLSPDGSTVAFAAQYEGPTEVYTMPVSGGLPTRLTFDGTRAAVVGWKTVANKPLIIASTTHFSTLPNTQLTTIDPATKARDLIPLAQASDGIYDDSGKTLFFTRLAFQGSQTKRYKGGTAQQLWKYADGDAEATGLTTDFPGTSYAPMWWKDHVYFLTDRDGTMEIWSMDAAGKDLKQLTDHNKPGTQYLDVKGPSLDDGKIIYQLGADIWVYDITANATKKLTITLDSDFDQTREHWVKKPMDYLTSAHISPDGDRVALTARGTVFVAPKGQGRLIEIPRKNTARQRDARFMPDGKTLLTISDQSGETELWTLPANGTGGTDAAKQITTDSTVLRWEGLPSPDSKFIASRDKDQRLFMVNLETKASTKIDDDPWEDVSDLAWSADSKWLAYTLHGANSNRQVKICNVDTGQATIATTDRFESFSPSWSPDGKWLYFISARHLVSTVGSPWGPRAPEPYFDNTGKVYALSLKAGERWPYAPEDELHPAKKDDKKDDKKDEPKKDDAKKDEVKPADDKKPEDKRQEDKKADDKPSDKADDKAAKKDEKKDEKKIAPIVIELPGLASRLYEVPIAPGNYSDLTVLEKRLLLVSRSESKTNLITYPIANKDLEVKTLVADLSGYELSADTKSLLIQKPGSIYIIESGANAPASLDKAAVNLGGWTFPITPREEWRQMFIESWRLERDYFYDSNMHGVDWKATLARYLPLADRVATRAELNDLIAQMVGELSALHIFVRGGDLRGSDTEIAPAALGGLLSRDENAGGYRIDKVFDSDPDEPGRKSPLAAPGVELVVGDIIEEVNGRPTVSTFDISTLLRGQSGKQVLLKVKPKAGGESKNVIIVPISIGSEEDLRYHEWEYSRRQIVDKDSDNQIGYVHLRAMGNSDFTDFTKGFYPIYQRAGLIIDARHNRGGNIDSWILSRLLRKAWFYWSPDVGLPYWNMQYAFRGHIVVLCNERTASDGEAFSEGIKRLKLGTVLGTRTWGGEIWLSSSNFLVDGGLASAAETGVFGPEGDWLIEGHGVEPDVVVDNLPHATFNGEDAQLKAAIELLKKQIKDQPVPVPPTPKRPNKAFIEK